MLFCLLNLPLIIQSWLWQQIKKFIMLDWINQALWKYQKLLVGKEKNKWIYVLDFWTKLRQSLDCRMDSWLLFRAAQFSNKFRLTKELSLPSATLRISRLYLPEELMGRSLSGIKISKSPPRLVSTAITLWA